MIRNLINIFLVLFLTEACQENVNKKHGMGENNLQFISSDSNANIQAENNVAAVDVDTTAATTAATTSTSTATTSACAYPLIEVDSKCYNSYSEITAATECENANGFWAASTSTSTNTSTNVSTNTSTSGGSCFQSISAVPQAECTSLKFVFSNGICYPSSTAVTSANGCFAAKQIYINNIIAGASCVTDYSQITSSSECYSALSSATATSLPLWLPTSKVCLQNTASVKTAAECGELGGRWKKKGCVFRKVKAKHKKKHK